MGKREKQILSHRWKREFDVALTKICLVCAGIGFAAGVVTSTLVVFLAR